MRDESNHGERYARGRAVLDRLADNGTSGLEASLAQVAPDMAGLLVAFAFGDVVSRPGLDLASREVCTVAALASLGNAQPQLRFHIGAALNAGLSPLEVVEIFHVLTLFSGFPAALNGLFAAREVFAERGLKPEVPEPLAGDRRARGLAALEATSRGAGQAVIDSLADLAPDMADFLIDFAYGDVIARPGLSARHKELVMICAAAARGGMRPQLEVHLRAGAAVGLTRTEITEALMQMAVYAGFPASLNALFAARDVLGPVE